MDTQLTLFDYQSLDTETRAIVQQRTDEIKTLMKRTARDIIEIGEKLIEVKSRLPHGEFGKWLEGEFGWADRTAQRFMNVASVFKSDTVSDLDIQTKALYLLAAPSTPEAARSEAIRLAENGQRVTHREAKDLVELAKAESVADDSIVADYCTEPLLPDGARGVNFHGGSGIVTCRTCQGVYDGDTLAYCPYCAYDPAVRIQHARNDSAPKPHVANNSGNNEWYTPSRYIEAARAVMGGIDTDPASSDIANETVGASIYFTEQQNGLLQNWRGRVWLNPPYSQPAIAQFAEKLNEEIESGRVYEAILLVNNATETAWFRNMLQNATAVCFPSGRVKFLNPKGDPVGAPLQGQAIIYIGEQRESFRGEFEKHGVVLYGTRGDTR